MGKPTLVISADIELAYGDIINPNQDFIRKYDNLLKKGQHLVDRIVESFDNAEISVTWAFVGNLLLDRPAMPRKSLRRLYENHLQTYQYEDYESLYSCRDFLEEVRAMDTPQEIALHSFFTSLIITHL